MQDRNRVIVALDLPDSDSALKLADELDPSQCRLKVGKELFTAAGPSLVTALMERGFEIFLDLKFHDIPHTVEKAVAAAARLGVWMLTVHACGGREMMLAARRGAEQQQHRPKLIAVTVLTSMTESDLTDVGVRSEPLEQVQRLAALAQSSGMDGVVCSAQETPELRKLLSEEFLLVTPGIRPAGDPGHDQKRIATPADAIGNGSSYLVIGRSITRARRPQKRLEQIVREIGERIP